MECLIASKSKIGGQPWKFTCCISVYKSVFSGESVRSFACRKQYPAKSDLDKKSGGWLSSDLVPSASQYVGTQD